MSKPILVGYDATTSDHAPVRFGVAAAHCGGALPIVVCVYRTAAARDLLGSRQVAEDHGTDDVERVLRSGGIRFEFRGVGNVSAARALHQMARAEEAGLLVVGSARGRAVGRVLPGSLVERLMQGAPCPVAVVRADWAAVAGPDAIGVDYVDTEEGREALRGAHALARRAGATLRVLTAEGAQRSAIAALGGEVAVETEVVAEDPADALIRATEDLDLLVCGSRGYGPPRAVSLGAVSRRVATEARCPVVVWPRGSLNGAA